MAHSRQMMVHTARSEIKPKATPIAAVAQGWSLMRDVMGEREEQSHLKAAETSAAMEMEKPSGKAVKQAMKEKDSSRPRFCLCEVHSQPQR